MLLTKNYCVILTNEYELYISLFEKLFFVKSNNLGSKFIKL